MRECVSVMCGVRACACVRLRLSMMCVCVRYECACACVSKGCACELLHVHVCECVSVLPPFRMGLEPDQNLGPPRVRACVCGVCVQHHVKLSCG